MTITFSERNKLWRNHQSYNYKDWWRNMDNRTLNYRHIGEEFHMMTIHMNKKCSIDRIGIYPCIEKWG